jgi:N-acetylglucosamine-6-phosphate deacetylase
MGNLFTTFTNCRLVIDGQIVHGERLVVSQDTGLILKSTGYIGGEIVDLDDAIVAPAFLDLFPSRLDGIASITSGVDDYMATVQRVAEVLPRTGVTGFWAKVPILAQSQLDNQVRAVAHSIQLLSIGP